MIEQKNEKQIELMRKAGSILGKTLTLMRESVRVGITTRELDKIAFDFIISQGALPAFLNYEGFPATICTSVNSVVVHGIPSDYVLKDGDIIGVDAGVIYKGYYSDACRTFLVGNVDEKTQQLVRETKRCFVKAIEDLKPGDRIGKISHAVESHARKFGYGVVKELCGHGIGKILHDDPQIPNYGREDSGDFIPVNCTLAIEPMINMGKAKIYMKNDDWTIVAADGKPSAHYENTILVTKDGVEVLTLMDGEVLDD